MFSLSFFHPTKDLTILKGPLIQCLTHTYTEREDLLYSNGQIICRRIVQNYTKNYYRIEMVLSYKWFFKVFFQYLSFKRIVLVFKQMWYGWQIDSVCFCRSFLQRMSRNLYNFIDPYGPITRFKESKGVIFCLFSRNTSVSE